jgi:hypothetical protein
LDEDVEVVSELEDDGEPEIDAEGSQRQEENGNTNHRFEVEVEIWDSFREEFHEGPYLSHLPSSKKAPPTESIDSG